MTRVDEGAHLDRPAAATGSTAASNVPSPACDAVLNADQPSHEDGGPCHDCALRRGSEASQTAHTVELARLCVEGIRPFYCHVHPGVCRGWVAAVNLRGAPQDEDDRRWMEVAAHAADVLGMCIRAARDEEDQRHV